MSDIDGDGIYDINVTMSPGPHLYRFQVDAADRQKISSTLPTLVRLLSTATQTVLWMRMRANPGPCLLEVAPLPMSMAYAC